MKTLLKSLLLVSLLTTSLSSLFAAQAADNAEAKRAQALLAKAVAYYKKEGDKAFAAFSRQGEFVDGDLYVFVVDSKGTMLASGGPSVVLIGRDVSSTLDPSLREQFTKALASPASSKVQQADYRWKNWADGRVERKHVYYQRVGERFIATGYYLPRATPERAVAMLDKAVKAVEIDPNGTFGKINALDGSFIEDDLYVFVVDLDTSRFVAHGFNSRMVGTDFASLKDPGGNPVGHAMLELARTQGEGEFEYQWRNPVTMRVENKHAYLCKAGHYLVAVGYYTR
ncbi:cache domain-containing protein [Pseudomonas sp. ZM23]|uniref:Cache domain-containing protein n=1 Tax=Pseudomonas triclosanedens TaxID=2961893 RepID=A0ABY7A3Q1_9PSED|nr:cache domain-containing protein [Pseudomonas triclosanedens]MCP8465756.1 cache domain-containing protein [Pseudomonas triclosanedens]MCP8471251.1 cache domain-containing protein [Pseudomonas triclosanedens]MCP8477055.1 cache domain-containing protein [Pseudomonas triclosanedens]WAI51837.1 cache domain-containing protein [Pseudomonas triclosanedens]